MRTFVLAEKLEVVFYSNKVIIKKMKKLVILLFLILPLGVIAQDIKIAYVNTQEIFLALPETNLMRTQLENLNSQYERDLKQMQDEYTNKFSTYVAQQDSLTENIRLRRQQELSDLQQRIENTAAVAQQDLQKKQQELMTPIQEKIQGAIKSVGDAQGYTCVLDPSVLLYTGSNAIDATSLVKTKLGL